MPAGRDRFLAALAFLAWALAGTPRLMEALARPWHLADMAWLGAYFAFALCLGGALGTRRPRRALAWTLGQAAAAVAVLPFGMPHFEGALLAVVGAQTRLVAHRRVAALWIAAQAVPLFVDVLPTHGPLGAAKATIEYLAFAAFAMVVTDLRQRERERRIELTRIHAELLGTRALLGETVRYGERARLRRELHDAAGHHLAALSIQLDRARAGEADALDAARTSLDALRDEARGIVAGLGGTIHLDEALSAVVAATPALRVRMDTAALDGIGPEAAWAVFRCIQEALTNAWKHGGAHEVTVACAADSDGWTVRIENDGAPPRLPITDGQGLRGMRERLAEIGARLSVDVGDRFALVASIPRLHTAPEAAS